MSNRDAVIVIPALLTPGIIARTWKKPIIKTFLIVKSFVKFFSIFCLSAKYKTNANINVVHEITSNDLKLCTKPERWKIKPIKTSGTEPKIRIMVESYDNTLNLKCLRLIKQSIN